MLNSAYSEMGVFINVHELGGSIRKNIFGAPCGRDRVAGSYVDSPKVFTDTAARLVCDSINHTFLLEMSFSGASTVTCSVFVVIFADFFLQPGFTDKGNQRHNRNCNKTAGKPVVVKIHSAVEVPNDICN